MKLIHVSNDYIIYEMIIPVCGHHIEQVLGFISLKNINGFEHLTPKNGGVEIDGEKND